MMVNPGGVLKNILQDVPVALCFSASGLAFTFNIIFGWHTSIAFGVSGMLWALMPLLFTAREMLKDRLGAAILLACSALMIIIFALTL
jgi:hypothetical protein